MVRLIGGWGLPSLITSVRRLRLASRPRRSFSHPPWQLYSIGSIRVASTRHSCFTASNTARGQLLRYSQRDHSEHHATCNAVVSSLQILQWIGLGSWDVSEVDDMDGLIYFYCSTKSTFNEDLSAWNVRSARARCVLKGLWQDRAAGSSRGPTSACTHSSSSGVGESSKSQLFFCASTPGRW